MLHYQHGDAASPTSPNKFASSPGSDFSAWRTWSGLQEAWSETKEQLSVPPRNQAE